MKDSKADYTASGISYDDHGCGTFTCMEKGKPLGTFTECPRAHNISNALASIALGRKTGLSYEQIAEGL